MPLLAQFKEKKYAWFLISMGTCTYLHNPGPQRLLKEQFLAVNGLTLGNGKQSAVKATSLISLQYSIHMQHSTPPTKSYSLCSLTNTNQHTSIVQAQCLPKVHITRISGREQRNEWTPSSMTAAKTVTVWGEFFHPQTQSTNPAEPLAVGGWAASLCSWTNIAARPPALCTAGPLLLQSRPWLILLRCRLTTGFIRKGSRNWRRV